MQAEKLIQKPQVDKSFFSRKAGEKCWIWRSLDGKETRDASALPKDPEEYLKRIQNGIWGPRWVRLLAVTFESDKGNFLVVKDIKKGGSIYEVPCSQVLPWYEGLLLLDAMTKSQTVPPTWLEDHAATLVEEKKTRRLSATLYVEKKLMPWAVTGPHTIDAPGSCWSHRRKASEDKPTGKPADVSNDNGWYRVGSIAAYLPPWEALIHPKCGYYQDFYMIVWGDQFATVDYSSMEFGVDGIPGATWEPEECIPSALDHLKMQAKKKWLEEEQKKQAQNSQQQVTEAGNGIKRTRVAAPEGALKKARNFNPKGLKLLQDILGQAIGHSIDKEPLNPLERDIKAKWPKHVDDYPPGYRPCEPPGCCSACDCMEDWHLGRLDDKGKSYLANHNRSAQSDRAVATLVMSGCVRKRGTVTQRCYLESNQKPVGDVKIPQAQFNLLSAAEAIKSVAMQVAKSIPLMQLKEQTGGHVFRSLGTMCGHMIAANPSEEHCGGHGPYVPSRFVVKSGPKNWFSIDAASGEVSINEDEQPALLTKKVVPMKISLMADNNDEAQAVMLECGLNVAPPERGYLEQPTREVVTNIQKMPPYLRVYVEARVASIFDFPTNQVKTVPIGVWMRTASEAFLMLRAAASECLFAPPPPPPPEA